MKDKWKGLFAGIMIGSMLTGATAMAASGTTIQVVMKQLGIYVDGDEKSSVTGLIYQGTTYVPIRVAAESVDKQVSLKDNRLYIGTLPKTVSISEDKAADLVYKKIKAEADKSKLHFMVDGEEGNKYMVRAFNDMEDHIATYGWYYVDRTTGKVTKYDLANGREVDL